MSQLPGSFYNYFSKNLIKGFVYLVLLIGLIVLFKSLFRHQYDAIEHAVSDNYYLMFLIFLVSEFFVGIIPPELFMIWSSDDPWYHYITALTVMVIVSLFAGWLNYRLGKVLSGRQFFLDFFEKKLKFRRYQQRYEQYGGGIIIISALTPLPFALISLMTGTLSFPLKKYLIFASFRIIRFVAYGMLIWNLHDVI